MSYEPNRWELYNPEIPNEQQPHSFITKRKLDKMEKGIQDANIPLEVGDIKMGNSYGVTITEDIENNVKKLNVTFPPAGKGAPGEDGKSAYEIWLELGNTGSEQEFLDYLKGIDGKDGKDGKDGLDGIPGPAGESAYQAWLAAGNTGGIDDFISSLKGQKGQSAYELWKLMPENENKTITEFFESLKGDQGPVGPAGVGTEFVDF